MFGRQSRSPLLLATQNTTLQLLKSSLFSSSLPSKGYIHSKSGQSSLNKVVLSNRSSPQYITRLLEALNSKCKQEISSLFMDVSLPLPEPPLQANQEKGQNGGKNVKIEFISADLREQFSTAKELIHNYSNYNINSYYEDNFISLTASFKGLFCDPQAVSFFEINSVRSVQRPLQSNYNDILRYLSHLFGTSADTGISLLMQQNPHLFPACCLSNSIFKTIASFFNNNVKLKQTQPPCFVLDQFQMLTSMIEVAFEQQKKDTAPRQLWSKVIFLMQKTPKHNSLIELYLQQHQQTTLLKHFRAITNGVASEFEPESTNQLNNIHFRQFLALLQRNWTPGKDGETFFQPTFSQFALSFKQIQLKRLFFQNYTSQVQTIKLYSKSLLEELKNKLLEKQSQQEIELLLTKLLYLGEFANVLDLLQRAALVDPIQVIWLLSELLKINREHSKFLLYQQEDTVAFFTRCMKSTLKLVNDHVGSQIIRAFLSSLHCNGYQKTISIDILTQSLSLFQFCLAQFPLSDFLSSLGLTVSDLSKLVSQYESKHSCFRYCAQLVLRCTLKAETYLFLTHHLSASKKISGRLTTHSSAELNASKDHSICTLGLDKIDIKSRRDILLAYLQQVCQTNLNLCGDSQRKHIFFQAAINTNNLLELLASRQMSATLTEQLQVSQSLLSRHINVLSFTKCLLVLKQHIYHAHFSGIVDIFNTLLNHLLPIDTLSHHLNVLLGPPVAQTAILQFAELCIQATLLLQNSTLVLKNKNLSHFYKLHLELLSAVKNLEYIKMNTSSCESAVSLDQIQMIVKGLKGICSMLTGIQTGREGA